jgi:predicted nucleic acid-binding protein
MIIPDTGVWIEFTRGTMPIRQHLSLLMDRGEVIALDCVFGELLQGVKSKREKDEIVKLWDDLLKIDYEGIFFKAGLYSYEHKLLDKGVGIIDAVVLMHGMESKSKIWTLDKKLLRVIPPELIYSVK